MIDVQNVSMRFNLGIEKNNSLKQMAVDLFSKSAREKRKMHKKENEFWALQDVSFKVEKGQVVGFVGSNGAGKSTLLKVVAGVMKPTKGKVLVGGNICPMIELGAGFDLDLNARENIYLNGAVMGYSKDFIDSKYQEIVDFSELHDFLEVPVRNFSSGMIARLAFSVATIVEPEILIVDEILSVGDLNFQKKSENKMLPALEKAEASCSADMRFQRTASTAAVRTQRRNERSGLSASLLICSCWEHPNPYKNATLLL